VGVKKQEMTKGAGPRQDNSLTAEQELVITEHLPVVRFIARRIHERLPQHIPIEDFYSAGVLGLVDVFGRFDPSKQVLFRSYAQFRIRGAILDSLRTLDWSPRELRRKGRAVEQAIQTLTAQYGCSPSESEIAQQLQIGLPAYQKLLGELSGLEIGTLHSERSEDPGEEELVYIPSRPEDDPLFRCLDAEMRQRLTEAISDLSERERLVMTLYYYEEMTMNEIGLILGVVESRVSQIHASAMLRLRTRLATSTSLRESQKQTRWRSPRTIERLVAESRPIPWPLTTGFRRLTATKQLAQNQVKFKRIPLLHGWFNDLVSQPLR
jgi:RNA polymerase sigma factor FliA